MREIVNQYIKGDRAIWLITMLLGVASLLLVYSSIVTLAYKYQHGNTFFYLLRHGFFLASGFLLIYVTHLVKFTYFARLSQLLLYISIPLLLITLLLGTSINEASRWLTIPVINQSFQTSDLAKLALIMFLARKLAIQQPEIKDFHKSFLPIVFPVFIVCALIFPANFSTAALLFLSALVLMFIGRISLKHITGLILLGVTGVLMAVGVAKYAPALFPRAETWISRVENFQQGESGSNYQADQAKIAIATGGIAGKGPGKSTQRNFLPHPYSDFIYAIVLEEYGMIGGFGILILYILLFFRCVKIAHNSNRTFGSLLVLGLSFMMVFQAFVNMAVAVSLIPVTGQPLPLVSMGGTSIWFTSISLGIILSVSRGIETEKEIAEEDAEEVEPIMEPANAT